MNAFACCNQSCCFSASCAIERCIFIKLCQGKKISLTLKKVALCSIPLDFEWTLILKVQGWTIWNFCMANWASSSDFYLPCHKIMIFMFSKPLLLSYFFHYMLTGKPKMLFQTLRHVVPCINTHTLYTSCMVNRNLCTLHVFVML